MNPSAFGLVPNPHVVAAGSSYIAAPAAGVQSPGMPPRVIRRVDGLGDPSQARPALPVRMPGDARGGDVIVFFPKHTTLPAGTFYSDIYDMTAYRTLSFQTGCEGIINSAGGNVVLEESGDLLIWQDATASQGFSSVGVVNDDASNLARWVRLRLNVGASGASMTIWAKGVARER